MIAKYIHCQVRVFPQENILSFECLELQFLHFLIRDLSLFMEGGGTEEKKVG
jgi:hypothetical protein